jgi:hypothetical protein
MANNKAAVEKLAGKINPKVINTGTHNSTNELLNVSGVSRVLER